MKTEPNSLALSSNKPCRILAAALTLFMLLPSPATGQVREKRCVLLVHAYHQGYPWTDAVTKGIATEFAHTGRDIELHITYMDTKRLPPDRDLDALEEVYAARYRRHRPEVLIVSDNNALDFVLARRDRLFPDVPIVFCGINDFHDDMLAGHDSITGVVEDIDPEGTIDLALNLHPDAKRLIVISDRTPTGRRNLATVNQCRASLENWARLEVWTNLAFDELRERLRPLTPDAVVLLMTFCRDSRGVHYNDDEYIGMVTSASPRPVYSLWHHYMGKGIVGGVVVSGRAQGRVAGEMALSILDGKSAGEIPIVRHSPNPTMLDYRAMQRFGLEPSDAPPDTIVINQPRGFYAEYWLHLWIAGIALIVFVLSTVLLGLNIVRRYRAERTLRESESKFRGLFEQSPFMMHSTNRDGVLVDVNEEWLRTMGYERDQVVGRPLTFISTDESSERLRDAILPRLWRDGASHNVPLQLTKQDGTIIDVLLSSRVVTGPTGERISLSVVHDVTERLAAKRALIESERRYRDLAETATDLISRHDAAGTYLYASPACKRLLGYEPEDLVGRSAYELFDSRDLSAISKSHETILRESGSYNVQYRIRRKDGSLVWFETNSRVIRDPDTGDVAEIVAVSRDITDRKQREDALRRSEERWRSLVENAPSYIVIVDRDARIQFLNRELPGVPVDEAIGSDVTRYVDDDSVEPIRNQLKRLFARLPTSALEVSSRVNGYRRWYDVQFGSIMRGQSVEAATLIATDITQIKQTQDYLRIQRDLGMMLASTIHIDDALRAVLDTALATEGVDACGVYLFNKETGKAELVSHRNLPEEFAAAVEEVPLDSPLLDLIRGGRPVYNLPPSTHPAVAYLMENDFCKGSAIIPVLHDDGTVGSLNVLSRSCGNLPVETKTLLESIAADIGGLMARLRAEAAQRASEENARALLNALDDFVALLDLDGTLLAVNEKVAERYERTVEDLLGTHAADLLPADAVERRQAKIAEVVETGQATVFEDEVDGLILSNTLYPVFDETGSVQRIALFSRDITERRRSELERMQLEEQLTQAQKMEALGRLAGGVAHDFNNLLTVILGNAEMIRGVAGEDVDEAVDLIVQAGEDAMGVTRSLLTFSRKMPADRRDVSLAKAVHSSVRLLRRILPASVEMETEIQSEPDMTVLADPVQIQQVIMNLSINARDAMPNGGTLRIGLEPAGSLLLPEDQIIGSWPVEDPPLYAKLWVADTGQGMSPEVRQRVFEPFFTTKSRDEGTGLGLSIVHGIIKGLNGRIELQSTEGVGTTFTLILPCSRPQAETDEPVVDETVRRGGGATVLVAEDHPFVRKIVCSALEARGHRVLRAEDGAVLRRLVCEYEETLDMLIVDIDLPTESGLDFLREYRRQGHDLPAIIMTGSSQVDVDDLLDESTALLRKPFRMSSLFKQMTHLIDEKVKESVSAYDESSDKGTAGR